MIDRVRISIRHRMARQFARQSKKIALGRPLVSFCFDDFPKSAAQTGAQILADVGAKASFYFCADFSGKTIDGTRLFDVEDLRMLDDTGHEIGCHTATHARVPEITTSRIQQEISMNSSFLMNSGVRKPMQTFAYPYGDVDLRAKRFLSSKFRACRGVFTGINYNSIDLSLLSCISLEKRILNEISIDHFIDRAISKNAWIIFLTHDVQEDPTAFGITPLFFGELVEKIASRDLEILTVESAINRIDVPNRA